MWTSQSQALGPGSTTPGACRAMILWLCMDMAMYLWIRLALTQGVWDPPTSRETSSPRRGGKTKPTLELYGLRNFSCGLRWTPQLLNQNQAISFGDFTLQPERFREPPGCRRTAHTIAPHGAAELRTLGPPWLPSKGGTDAVWGGSTCVCQPCIVGAYVRGMAIEGSWLRSPAAFRRRGRALQPILLDCPFFTFALDRTVAIQPGACKGQMVQVQRSHSRARV